MKIYFKDVGQGDSIILEWEEDSIRKLAIVDCNIKTDTGTNPVLDYIKTLTNFSIEFLILSHPHTDHFSGINQLFDYAEINNIHIRRFIHTCNTTKSRLMASVKGIVARNELTRMLIRSKELFDKGVILDRGAVDSGLRPIFDLNDEWKLAFLAPSHEEIDLYSAGTYKHLDEGKINSSDANLLATSIKIYNDHEYIILNSDLTKGVFEEVWNRHLKNDNKMMRLCQVSHHGSASSFNADFWSKIRRVDGTPAIISVGKNDYGHPSENVISSMRSMEYKVHLTNDIKQPVPSQKVAATKSKLNLISKPVIPMLPLLQGKDIVFSF